MAVLVARLHCSRFTMPHLAFCASQSHHFLRPKQDSQNLRNVHCIAMGHAKCQQLRCCQAVSTCLNHRLPQQSVLRLVQLNAGGSSSPLFLTWACHQLGHSQTTVSQTTRMKPPEHVGNINSLRSSLMTILILDWSQAKPQNCQTYSNLWCFPVFFCGTLSESQYSHHWNSHHFTLVVFVRVSCTSIAPASQSPATVVVMWMKQDKFNESSEATSCNL